MELKPITPDSEKFTPTSAGESGPRNENYGTIRTNDDDDGPVPNVHNGEKNTSWIEILQSAVGVALAIIGGVFYATEGLFVALAEKEQLQPLVVFFLMQVFMLLSLVIPIIILRPSLIGKSLRINGLLLVNAAGYLLNEMNYVYAISLVPIGNVTAIINGCLPVFTALLAMYFLKEDWKKLDFVVTIVNICGIILISCDQFILADELEEATELTNSSYLENDYEGQTVATLDADDAANYGYALAVLAGLGNSISVVTNRRLEEVSVLTRLLYAGVISLALSAFGFIYVEVVWPQDYVPYLYNFGAGLTDMLALAAAYSSLHTENAATVAVILNLEIVISYILGFVVLGEIPSYLDTTGAALVFLGSTTVFVWTWYQHFKTSKTNSKVLHEENNS